jgi:hypothetical protein
MGVPMPLGSFESTAVSLLAALGVLEALSSVMVDVEELRLNVFASGARCVSLSFFVIRHVEDMVAVEPRKCKWQVEWRL